VYAYYAEVRARGATVIVETANTPWSKQESTATTKLVNLARERASVSMAYASGTGPQQTAF
jgi:hypothetical protein